MEVEHAISKSRLPFKYSHFPLNHDYYRITLLPTNMDFDHFFADWDSQIQAEKKANTEASGIEVSCQAEATSAGVVTRPLGALGKFLILAAEKVVFKDLSQKWRNRYPIPWKSKHLFYRLVYETTGFLGFFK